VNSGTGFQVKTSSTALTNRSIAVTGAGLSITNGDGISGDPTIGLTGQVLNLANLSANGLMTISSGGAISATSIVGTASQIDVANGNGVSGVPTISIASNPALPGLAGVVLPSGSSSDRSGSAVNGTLRYNTDFAVLEAYINGSWATLSAGSTGVTSVATGTGLTGGPITSVGTISIANTAVTAGSYTAANITVNAQGQITAASSNATLVSSFSAGTTGFTPSTATTGAVTLAGTLNVANGGTGATTLTGYVFGNGTSAMTASATIPNAGLTNSSVTIGTTAISLGASSLTLGGLTSVAVTQDPVSALQLATKQYVDTIAVTSVHYHSPVFVESPNTVGNLNATYNQPGGAGVGVGATLTNAGTQVALTIDGVLMTVGKRVLIYNQTSGFQNGVYTVTTVGTVSTNWVLTRATDADTYSPISSTGLGGGDAFFVTNGDTGAGETYVCTNQGVIVFGTTDITFVQISSAQIYSAGAGLTLNGTTFSLTTPVTAILGGTGQTSYTTGDLLYASGSTALSKLGIGTASYVLTSSGSAPQYVAQSTLSVGSAATATTATTATSATTATNLAGGIASQIPYQTGAGATSFIANGTAGQVLTSAGTSVPTWSGISGGTF
jgi:hypothetical protein